MTTLETLRALAAEMCEAKEGSRDLDLKISVLTDYREVFGPHAWEWNVGGDEIISATGGVLDPLQFVPRWTTSLDAKLPGEDIVVVAAPGYMISGNIGSDTRWMAQQRNAANCRSKAHTEPLARRAAGLLAMAQEKESA